MTSRSVMIAATDSPSRTTAAPTPRSAIAAAASPIVATAETVNRLAVMCSETDGMSRFYDPPMEAAESRASGRCLCGAVTYQVRGLLRDVVLCHCVECRRWSGTGAGAFTSAYDGDLVISGDALTWIDSPASSRSAKRGFCSGCGSSMCWRAADAERTGIAAGTLDPASGLQVTAHIYTHDVADWDALPGDGTAHDPDSSFAPRWS